MHSAREAVLLGETLGQLAEMRVNLSEPEEAKRYLDWVRDGLGGARDLCRDYERLLKASERLAFRSFLEQIDNGDGECPF